MSLRIGTNIASIAAQRNLQRSSAREEHALKALASGSRIVDPSDDAAGFAISEQLRAQVHSLSAAKNNAEAAKGFLQVAEGGLNEQNNILIRLRELAMQSASDTVGDDERGYIDIEFQQLSSEVDRIAKTTTYAGSPLLQGATKTYQFQLGTHSGPDDVVSFRLDADTRGSALGIEGMSVSDRDDASSNLSGLDGALAKVSKARASFGAAQTRFEYAAGSIDVQRENTEAARSRIADADVAFESSELAQGRVLQDFGTAVLAQANQSSERALRLLA